MKMKDHKRSRKTITRVASGNAKATLASFQVAKLIAESREPHTIAEEYLAAQIMLRL